MSYTVKIVNNDTDEVLIDEKDSGGIVGALLYGGNNCTESFQYLQCNGSQMSAVAIAALESVEIIHEKYPFTKPLGELIRMKHFINESDS